MVDAEAVDITGYVGFMPVLPESITVSYTDGSKGTARVESVSYTHLMAIFKLQENSPAVDAGVVIPESDATEDIFGNKIVDLPDIGAHEFNNDPGPVDAEGNKAEKVILDRCVSETGIISGK